MKWKYSNFSDVVNDITGGNMKFQSSEYLSSGKYPIIDQGEKEIGGYTNQEDIVNKKKDVVVFGDHTKCLKFIDYVFCLGADGVKVLEPINELDTKFLYFYLSTITLPNVGYSRHFKFLKEIQIPLPPLPIQKRIAEILDAADALRRKDQELLRKYDELAQAIFIDMFGDPVKNEKGWEVKTIKSSTNIITYGLTVRPQYMEEGIPLISARELRSGFVNYEAAPKISNADFKKLSNKCKPQNGDILFSKTGSIGHSAIVETTKDFAVTQNAARINFKTEFYEIYFIFALLRQEAFINKCISLVKGNAVKDLQLGDFSEIEIICPPIELQRKFSEISMKSNNLIKASDNNSITSNNLFKSLLQQAFKGELVK